MDGRGRWVDNVFIERLWKSVKYEEVYLKAYDSIAAVARKKLRKYFDFYNKLRCNQGLNKRLPDEVYWGQHCRSKSRHKPERHSTYKCSFPVQTNPATLYASHKK